jgi:hypothetical protein
MKKTAQMTQATCLIAMLLALPLSVLANKLLEPGTSGGIGGTGNTPTKISDNLLQPSSAKNKNTCTENLKVGSYLLESAGKVSVSNLCIGQEIEMLNGDRLRIKLNNSEKIKVRAFGRIKVNLTQDKEYINQTQDFDIKIFVESGTTLISFSEHNINEKKDMSRKILVRKGVIFMQSELE